MLHGIRASTLTVPSYGHSLSLTGAQKMDGYGDVDPWAWASDQPTGLPQNYPAIFDQSLHNALPNAPQTMQHRQPSTPKPHPVSTTPMAHTRARPPPATHHATRNLVKDQPAFKTTWHGFLDTTLDAMTIVEAALQGRLSHISRRPHEKERTEMLTSGTVLVYEENASGIKRWTDAVHWSPSRVMYNCLIYRQLTRALKPEEKKSSGNPVNGSKRKRKASTSPSITDTGDCVKIAEDEYERSTIEAASGEATPTEPYGRVYANSAQTLTMEQQRRFCGSLVDSYDFKEGGLMKKTISVKYQGTHHHVISYYTLEDVIKGKLNRPFQDPSLADIQPRPELLDGWKVSLEDEEMKETHLYASYSQPPSHVQHSPESAPAQDVVQAQAPLHMHVPSEYWHGTQSQQYIPPQPNPSDYAPPQHTTSIYAQQLSQQYRAQRSSAQQYHSQQPSEQQYSQAPTQQYPQQPIPRTYISQEPRTQHYSAQAPDLISRYSTQPQATHHYASVAGTQQYSEQPSSNQYRATQNAPVPPQTQSTVPQIPPYDLPISVSQTLSPVQQTTQNPFQQQDSRRTASAPIVTQTYGQPEPQSQYQPEVKPQPFYIAGKYDAGYSYMFKADATSGPM